MAPEERARKAYREFSHISGPKSLFDLMVKAIRDAEKDAYQSVFNLLNEHKECESCVVIDELEDQIKGLGDGQ